jgi:2-succinyl-5-enolpyruvyl-6-hydroxy-3-cyclohexene-1-carboxylate synthase
MFSSKANNNILTALLGESGGRDAVVCPGSRNSAIVHNLKVCASIRCHGVTDERSAGFYALGISQATGSPVVVCVTSGTALLNLLPAVAEAWYQHWPLVVVSGDRPPQWIDQLDGQTLPQNDALRRLCARP